MNTQNPKIKILISYHDKHPLIKSDILLPIQTGCALAEERFEGMLQDDDGENISAKNPKYAELTAQYWAWKNYDKLGNPDYIGFMHYRRNFVFADTPKFPVKNPALEKCYQLVYIDRIEETYLQDIGLTDADIEKEVPQYDCICVREGDFSQIGIANSVEDYEKRILGSQLKDLELFFELIERDYPEYIPFVKRLQETPYKYLYNMFIMRRDLFERYNQFLFSVLEKLEEEIDITYYPANYTRVLAYLGEFCLSLFINKLKSEQKWKIKETRTSFILDTSVNGEIKPAFGQDSVTLAVSCSNEYVPYLSVWLASVLEHISESEKYDILIFEHTITAMAKEKLLRFAKRENVSVRFVNPMGLLQKYNLYVHEHFSLECYFRITAPRLLSKYNKILFTDLDLVFMSDPAYLFKSNLQGKVLGAALEVMWSAFLNNPATKEDIENYSRNSLSLKNVYQYFNTGVLLVDVQKFNKTCSLTELLQLAQEGRFRFLEQDLLNKIFQNQFHILPLEWNVLARANFEWAMPYISNKYLIQYLDARKGGKVIHFAGGIKPWWFVEIDFADVWWSYARKTPYYEEICLRLNHKMITDVLTGEFEKRRGNYYLIYFRYLRCKLMAHITFGKKRAHYREECLKAKNKVQFMRQFRQ